MVVMLYHGGVCVGVVICKIIDGVLVGKEFRKGKGK